MNTCWLSEALNADSVQSAAAAVATHAVRDAPLLLQDAISSAPRWVRPDAAQVLSPSWVTAILPPPASSASQFAVNSPRNGARRSRPGGDIVEFSSWWVR